MAALLGTLLLPPTAAAVTRVQAERAALRALKVNSSSKPLIVFRLRAPLSRGTVITENGTSQPVGPRRRRASNRRQRVRNAAGVAVVRLPVIARVGRERAWFFYEDQGPYQAYQHPGRVVLVGERSGRVRISRTLRWAPLINSRLPVFLALNPAYLDARYRAFAREWALPRALRRPLQASAAVADPTALSKARGLLAREGSCFVRISDTVGVFYDSGPVESAEVGLSGFFVRLGLRNSPSTYRYSIFSGTTPAGYIQRQLIGRDRCRDIFVYIAGGGFRTGTDAVNVGNRTLPGGISEQQNITAADLRAIIARNPRVTFKLKVDAPYSADLLAGLRGLRNLLIFEAAAAGNQASFEYLPPLGGAGETPGVRRRLAFTTRQLIGLERFLADPREVDHAAAAVALGRAPSFMAWMLARGFALGADQDIAEQLGVPPQIQTFGFTPAGPSGPANRAPTATDQSVTVTEDEPKDVTLTGSDPDGDVLSFAVTANPSHGTLTGSGASLTYTPNAEFSGSDSFTFSVSDGRGGTDTGTVTITVKAENDPPVVTTSGGSLAYTEGDPAAAVDSGLTVTDVDDTQLEDATVRISGGFQFGDELVFADQLGITGTYNSGTGVLTLTGTASVSDYQVALRSVQYRHTGDNPAANKVVEFKADDGDSSSAPATRSVFVTGVNDAPTVDATNSTLAYSEGEGPTPVDGLLQVADPDSQIQGATVQITSNFVEAEDDLAFVNQSGITGSYDDTLGKLTLTGTASVADYRAALRSVTYENSADNPSTGTRTVSFQVTDDSAEPSNVDTRDINVSSSNDAPVVTTSGGSTAYTEGAAAAPVDGALTVSDADDTSLEGGQVRITSNFESGDDLVFVNQNGISGVYNTGTGVLTLTGTASVADYQTALRSIAFRNTTDDNLSTPKTVEFTVDDGDFDSEPATKDVAITPVNDAPTLDTTNAALSYTEDAGPVAVDPGLTVTDPDSTQLVGATVQITSNFSSAEDDLAFVNQLGITGTYNDATGTLTLTGTASLANYQTALRSVTYENSSDTPSTVTRTVSFRVDDGGAVDNLSNVVTRDVNVSPANDAPTVTTSVGSASYTEGDPAVTIDGGATVTDVDDTNLEGAQVRISANFQSGDNLVFATQNGISGVYNTGTGVLTLTGTSSVANYQTGLRSITFATTNGDPSTPKTVEFKVNDGDADSNLATRQIDITPVNSAPVADDETFDGANSAVGNTTFIVNDPDDGAPTVTTPNKTTTGDILAGDTDPDGPGPLIITNAGTFATNDGGSVTLEADGDFTYQPATGTSCTDTSDFFDYTVSDQNPGTPGTDTGRVNITLSGCVWYVKNDATAGGDGDSDSPFDTLAEAETASSANHTVFVYDGNNSSTNYDTGFAMNSGERLIGEHEGLTVGSDTLYAANPGAHPTLTANNEDVVELDDGNEVRGFNLDPQGTGGGIAGAAGDTGGGTIDDVNVVDTGVAGSEPALDLTSTTGTFNFSNLVVDNTGAVSPPNTATGVQLSNAGTVNFQSSGQTSITTTGAKGLDAVSTNMGSGSTFDDITVSGSSAGGVSMVNTTGTTTFGDGSGTDLSLVTTSGSAPAFNLSSAGTVTVAAAGTDELQATGGPAIDVTSTSGPTLEFDDVDSTNSAGDGINLGSLGTGTFSATSGDIAGAGGISFDLEGGSGAITYPGNFSNGDGTTAIEVTGRSGGIVSLSGPISDTNDSGGRLNVSSNTGGSTVLSAATKQFNTGTSDGVSFTSSDGHTLVLSGGGTDIDTTSGNGLAATTSGTVEVSGSGNTIDTTTGRGLNISDTDIAAADVTFQRIRTDGAPTGIRLNNTGTSGNLAVTGAGGTCTNADTSGCSGGEIENGTGSDSSSATPDGSGIVLNNTTGPEFTRMWIHDHSNYGIRGTAVNGFTLANSVINGTNGTNSSGTFNDSSIYFDNDSGSALTGSASISDTHVQGGFTNNIWVSQTSGSLNRLTMDTITVGANSTTDGNAGLMVEGLGTSTTNVTLQNSTLTSSRAMVSQFIGNGSGGGDLDFYNNTLSNDHSAQGTGSGLLAINGGAAGTFNVDVSTGGIGDNTFQDALGHAVNIVKSNGSGTLTGNFTGNSVGTDDPSDNSGSEEGDGLKFQHAGGGGTATLSIASNTIREYNNFGIELQASAGGVADSGTMNANVTGNTVTDPGSNPSVTGFQGIAAVAGVLAGDAFTLCAHIKANSVVGSGVEAGTDDLRARARFNSTVNLPGYGGGNTDTSAVATFLANQNDANPNSPAADAPVPTASASVTSPGVFTGNGTGCP